MKRKNHRNNEMLERWLNGETFTALAAEFGVSYQAVQEIVVRDKARLPPHKWEASRLLPSLTICWNCGTINTGIGDNRNYCLSTVPDSQRADVAALCNRVLRSFESRHNCELPYSFSANDQT